MKMMIFAVRDELNGFGQLFTAPTEAFAKRDMSAAVNNDKSNSAIAYSPKDFSLYKLGVFDDTTGVVESLTVPEFIVRGSDLIAD